MFTGMAHVESIGKKRPRAILKIDKSSFSHIRLARNIAHKLGHMFVL